MWPNCTFLTNTASVARGQSDEAFLAPRSVPWVLDFPNTVYDSNQQDCVINLFSTVAENSWWIMRPSSSVYCHWYGSPFQCIYNPCAFWWLWDRIDLKGSALFFACLIHSFVRVGWFWIDPVIFNVFQTSFSWTSVAAMISVRTWAINQLLLRKVGCFALK